jgi:hypothetical protein
VTDHKLCPTGSHVRHVGAETITFTCSITGSEAVATRCAGITKKGERCQVGLWAEGKTKCRHHLTEGEALLAFLIAKFGGRPLKPDD